MPASFGSARASSRSATSGAPSASARRPALARISAAHGSFVGSAASRWVATTPSKRAVRVQQARRLAVQARALRAQIRLHRLPHHRMHEARVLRVDQVRVGERAQLPRRLRLAEPGERGDAREARRVAEHGGRAGDRQGGGGERADARRDPARDGGADGFGLVGAAVERCRAQQFREQQRVPARGLEARLHERRFGVELGLHERGDARLGERLRAVQTRHRRRRESVQQRLLGARLGGPRADREQHRQVLHPARQRVQEAQARRVRPVRVVDHDQQRLLGRQVRREPVEPVQRRVRGVLAVLRVRGAEHRLGEPRGAGEQPRAAFLVGRVQLDVEQLAHDPEREVALQRPARGREHLEALLGPLRAQDPQQRRLAVARGRLQQRDRPGRGAGGLQLGREALELSPALEQRVGAGVDHGPKG